MVLLVSKQPELRVVLFWMCDMDISVSLATNNRRRDALDSHVAGLSCMCPNCLREPSLLARLSDGHASNKSRTG